MRDELCLRAKRVVLSNETPLSTTDRLESLKWKGKLQCFGYTIKSGYLRYNVSRLTIKGQDNEPGFDDD